MNYLKCITGMLLAFFLSGCTQSNSTPNNSVTINNNQIINLAADGASLAVTITNNGPSGLENIQVSSSNANIFTVTSNCFSLSNGESCSATLTSTAGTTGGQTANLNVSANHLTPESAPVTLNSGLTFSSKVYSAANAMYYINKIAGPSFLAVLVQNNDPNTSATLTSINTSGLAGKNITLDNEATDYGNFTECGTSTAIPAASNCLLIFQAIPYDATATPLSGTLSLAGTLNNSINKIYSGTITLTNTTEMYLAGEFNKIAGLPALSSGQYLLAMCTKSTTSSAIECSNYISDTQNYANGVINRVALADNGNLYVGGNFTQIGNAQTASNQYLLAKCVLGSCVNALNTSPNYANDTIQDISVDHDLTFYVGGHFNQIGGASLSSGYLLASCTSTGCINALGNGSANGAINTLRVDHENNTLYAAGAFTSINNSADIGHPYVARCYNGTCENFLPSSATKPYASAPILIADDASGHMYIGGDFSEIADVSETPNKLLAKCLMPSNPTTETLVSCANYLSTTTPYANESINATMFDGNSNLFVGGVFTQLGNASVSGTCNQGTGSTACLVAHCSSDGATCNNMFGLDANRSPNGVINSISVGSILTAN